MKRRKFFIVAIIGFLTICSFVGGAKVGESRGIPFVKRQIEWSIGIYTGDSPFHLISSPDIKNPVLTAKDVKDVKAEFVSDPFMVNENSMWYMFFEVMNAGTHQGDIGLAISNDGLKWNYKKIVLDEPFSLSYPYVFKWGNDYYMIPESCESYSVRLYKAVDFPTRWSFDRILIKGNYFDSSLFYYHNKWWMFTSDRNDVLCLFYADSLVDPWTEHPDSPLIVGNANISRPGGRVLVLDGHIIRYAQDDDPTYGNKVRAFEITNLTTENYEENEISNNPTLEASGTGWNEDGMHNIDPHQIGENKFIACVDGYREDLVFGLGY